MNRAFKATGASHGLTQRLVFMCTHLLFGLVTTAFAAIHWWRRPTTHLSVRGFMTYARLF